MSALEAGKKPETAAAEKKLEPPKRENFKTDEEFDEAKFDYRYQMRRAKEAVNERQNATQAELNTILTNYQESVAEFKEEHDDWDEVMNQSIPVHDAVIFAVHQLENGPAVSYYLGKHPTYTKKLATMSMLAAVMEVGRLADRLKTGAPNRGEADAATTQKTRKRIPAPVTPVRTAATSSTLTSREAAKKGDFKGFRQAQRAGR